jgi:hypothetical protein
MTAAATWALECLGINENARDVRIFAADPVFQPLDGSGDLRRRQPRQKLYFK